LKNSHLFLSLISTILLIFQSCTMKNTVDTLLYNARIHTIDSSNTVVDAIAIHKGKIVETGTWEDLSANYRARKQIDLKGKPVFPGFIDSHSHFYGYALNLQWIDLVGCASFSDVIDRLPESFNEDTLIWITGRGWDQNLWDSKQLPGKDLLDKLYPEIPVVLVRVCGHMLLANQKALDIAGLDSQIFAPGEVVMNNGLPTGILKEKAADWMRKAIPKPKKEQLVHLLKEAQHNCFASGLTSVTDAGLDEKEMSLMHALYQDKVLKINLYAMLEPTSENLRHFVSGGPFRTGRLHVCSVKMYADGSLGSRTALLKHPYSDDPGNLGIQVTSADSIREICKIAYDNGYQVNIHCIGDSAVRIVLDVYGSFLKGKNDLRWRIEHAQVVDPADMLLFQTHSIIPAIQSTHATSDMFWAPDRLGPVRIHWAYAYRELLEQNGWIPNGTDFPIERISPLLTFYAATARKNLAGLPEGGFQMKNALSREEALRSITLWAAKGCFDDEFTGSLEPGKIADLVVLDQDIMEIPLEEIPDVSILRTFSHGEEVYYKKEADSEEPAS
jgi:predicted amidohydrolase YtcJ